MIKCEECISFVICIQKIKIIQDVRYKDKNYSTLSLFDTTAIHDCKDFLERFQYRDPQTNAERDMLKQMILEAKGLI